MAEAAAVAAPAPKSGKGKLIVFSVLGVLLLAGGGGGAFVFLKKAPAEDEAAPTEQAEAEAPKPAQYFSLAPSFVVNFTTDADGKRTGPRYLKVDVDGVTRDAEMLAAVQTHTPMIRNALIMLFSRQRYEDLIAPEGKEKLRADALLEVQKVMEKETGKPVVEEVFFTNFIMQ